LRGFKENVIMGHLIPAGTGYPTVRAFKLTKLNGEPDESGTEPTVAREAEQKKQRVEDNRAEALRLLNMD